MVIGALEFDGEVFLPEGRAIFSKPERGDYVRISKTDDGLIVAGLGNSFGRPIPNVTANDLPAIRALIADSRSIGSVTIDRVSIDSYWAEKNKNRLKAISEHPEILEFLNDEELRSLKTTVDAAVAARKDLPSTGRSPADIVAKGDGKANFGAGKA